MCGTLAKLYPTRTVVCFSTVCVFPNQHNFSWNRLPSKNASTRRKKRRSSSGDLTLQFANLAVEVLDYMLAAYNGVAEDKTTHQDAGRGNARREEGLSSIDPTNLEFHRVERST